MDSNDTLLHSSVVRLLMGQLNKLAQGHFFSEELQRYITELKEVLLSLQDPGPTSMTSNPEMKQLVTESVWRATQYLAGSTSNRIPYEIVYSLRHALDDWDLHNCLITTSLLKSSDFHCARVNAAPAQTCAALALKTEFTADLVQIAFPEIFEHSPIFCSPLYHEIGHYVEERQQRIRALSMEYPSDERLALLPDHEYVPMRCDDETRREIFKNHTIEHFCDLFAASYIGECAAFYIEEWAPDYGYTPTHPSTQSRVKVIYDFLNGVDNSYLSLILESTVDSDSGNQLLRKRFTLPDVTSHYSDVRPCEIASIEELHGIFPAALAFMKNPQFTSPTAPQKQFKNKEEISTVVNDLTEKSIRNFMIKRAWNEHLDQRENQTSFV